MAPPVTFLRHRGATPQVIRYLNSTPTPLGNTFGTDDAAASPQYWTRRNPVAQVGGGIYAVTYDGVYRLKPDGVTWSNSGADGGLIFTNPDLAAGQGVARSGLTVFYIGSSAFLCGWYKTTTGAGNLRGYRLDVNGGGWSEQTDIATISALGATDGGSPHNEIPFRGLLYFGTAANGGVVTQRTYNPSSGAFATLTHPISNVSGLNYLYDYCVLDNVLYMVTPIDVSSGVNGRPRLYALAAGSWLTTPTLLDTVPANLGATNGGVARWCLFTDGTNLYALCLVNTDGVGTNYGWRCYQIDSSLLVTDISTTVLPTSLLSPDDGGGAPLAQTGRFTKFIDVDTLPTVPAIYLRYTVNNDPAQAINLFQWVSNAAPMTLIETNGVASDAGPNLAQTGGDRIFTPGEMNVLITNRQPVLSGEQIFFRAWGNPGPSDKFVRFYFNKQGEPPAVQCVLTGSATGGVAARVGNELQNIEADDGVTEYSITWNISGNSVVSGDRVQLVPRISVT
jgi:hypothetical protein